jgi:hypothetical protein
VLGYRPVPGSPFGGTRQHNYRFGPADRDAIIRWINHNLDVNWVVLPWIEVEDMELHLIRKHRLLLNLKDNPTALPELERLRALCREIGARPATAL